MAPTVVLLHGFTHTGASWDRVIAALPQGYRALAPDLRGHGRAGAAGAVDLESVLDDVAALAPADFTLVGYSMGGRIALHLALRLGPRVGRLVLVGASPGIADPSEREARRDADERLADEIERMDIESFARKWAATPVLSGQPPEVAAAVHADRLRNEPAALAQALRGLGTGALPPLWDRLEELSMPVTLVAGERDQKFSEIAARVGKRLRGASVVIVPGVGHAVHLEAPERLAAVIAAGPARCGSQGL